VHKYSQRGGVIHKQNVKYHIFSVLVFVLGLSSLLSLLVTIMFWQRDAVRSTVHNMQVALKTEVMRSSSLNDEVYPALCHALETVSEEHNWYGGHVQSDHFTCSFGQELEGQTHISKQMGDVLETGETSLSLFGTAWGLIMPTKKFAAVVQPLLSVNGTVGAACVFSSLEPVYKQLRSDLGAILGCLVVNTLVLTFIGFSRFYHLTIKPIQQLIQVADSYEESGLPFLTHESGGEYRQLRSSLNQMLERISEDKHRLKQSVESLEKANAQILATREEMIQAEKLSSVGRLASGLAHEIGNPVGIVLGYLDLLKGECSEREKNEFIARSETELNRISVLIRQLLDFSRTVSSTRERISVHMVIQSVVELLQPQPFMNSVDLICCLDADDDIIDGNRDQLQQVFINALLNAADAIHARPEPDHLDKGNITIATDVCKKEPFPYISVKVRDNGVGVKEEDLQNVFDPFFTSKEPGKGTGLGLSVSFSHVENLGGKMKMTNNSDSGVTLHILLPLHLESSD